MVPESISLLNLAKKIRLKLPENVQTKYSTIDIRRILALLLKKAGKEELSESSYKLNSKESEFAEDLFYKAYPSLKPAKLTDGVIDNYRETGMVLPSFDYHGKRIYYDNQMWYNDKEILPREKIAWAEKQFALLVFDLAPSASILVDIGDQVKKTGPKKLAALFYEEAFEKADTEKKGKILIKLTGVYKALHMPLRTLKLYQDMPRELVVELSCIPFMAAVGNAYCDLNNYVEAKAIADFALSLGNGKQGADLTALYRRIRTGNGTGK